MSGNTNTEVLLAGAIAAFSVDLLVYPLDTLKTRFQSRDYKKLYYDPAKNAVNKAVFFRGLYQGVGSIILVTLPSSAIFFTTYEALRSGFKRINPILNGSQRPQVPQPFIDSAASSIAELASCLVLTPAEVIKQNAQIIRRPVGTSKRPLSLQDSPTYRTLKSFRKPTQLFRGYSALVARNLPYTAMQFPLYEHFKKTIHVRRQHKGMATGTLTETATVTAVSASTSGSFAAFLTTPVDVVKTRVMLSAREDHIDTSDKKTSLGSLPKKAAHTRGAIAVAREVLAESGAKGLFRGATLRSAWAAVGSGLYLAVYESGRVWLGKRRNGKVA